VKRSTLVPKWRAGTDVMSSAIVRRGAEETLALTRALTSLAARGVAAPCQDPVISHWFCSENAAERRRAAEQCRPCPVLGLCGQAATARSESWFVWGGKDRTRFPRRAD
jgi:hypothetical protein